MSQRGCCSALYRSRNRKTQKKGAGSRGTRSAVVQQHGHEEILRTAECTGAHLSRRPNGLNFVAPRPQWLWSRGAAKMLLSLVPRYAVMFLFHLRFYLVPLSSRHPVSFFQKLYQHSKGKHSQVLNFMLRHSRSSCPAVGKYFE